MDAAIAKLDETSISALNSNNYNNAKNAVIEDYRNKIAVLQTQKIDELRLAEETGADKQKIIDKYNALDVLETEKKNESLKQLEMKRVDSFANTATQGISIFSSFADSITEMQLNSSKKSEAEKKRIEKTAFNRNKVVTALNTGISGAQAIMQSYAQLGPVAGSVAAVLMGVMTAAQIAAIMSKKFPEGDGGSVSSISAGGGGSPAGLSSQSTPFTPSMFTGLNASNQLNNQADQRVYIYERDITMSQNRQVQIRNNQRLLGDGN